MATITSGTVSAGNATTAPVGGGMICRYAKIDVGTSLALNDVIQAIPVAAGDIVHDIKIKATDLDTGAALVLDVGDGDTADRYINGSTVGQAGGADELDTGVTPYQYATSDTIDVLVQVAAATPAAGSIEVWAYITGKM